MHHVTGIFGDAESAEKAVRGLVDAHFAPDDISVVVSDRDGLHEEPVQRDTGVKEGAIAGVTVGGLVGAIGGTLVATGVVVAPGLGLLASGPLLAALKGAAAGAAAGLEIGALAGLGFWKDEADIHANALEEGGVVVAVPAEHEHAARAREVFSASGAKAIQG